MDGELVLEERRLIPHWSPELIALSYCISWLGAYTSTQIIIHAKYTPHVPLRWLWTLLASVAFGFSAIWSMHFVGMLACRLDVDITFNIMSTILSACVAVLFTFAAISSAYATKPSEASNLKLIPDTGGKTFKAFLAWLRGRSSDVDIESGGYLPVRTSPESLDIPTSNGLGSLEEVGIGEDGNSESGPEGTSMPEATRPFLPNKLNHSPIIDQLSLPYMGPVPSGQRNTLKVRSPVIPRQVGQTQAPGPPHVDEGESSARDSLSTDDSVSGSMNDLSQSGSAPHSSDFNESLRAGLSREARLRIKAQAQDRPVPHFGWKYWLKAHYGSISLLVTIRAAIWAVAIAFMHYCGMWAMEIPEGRISWDLRMAAVSYVVAFAVCFVGCIAMVHMEVDFGRQVAFSTIVSAGCCSMHYTGMAAATFYSYAPPNPNSAYPAYLPFTIIGIAVFVCIVSNAILAHSAINSRNRMAEMILTKRRLWRIMAEKEAAEQANELKQQFISVASHEIRTPLHAVNGYCELLALTNLTEEQALYVTSIQQAYHAISVITGNVLDFSKLDRNNVELSARPVLVDLRKMVENLARITEMRVQPGQPAVDVIVSVSPNVPPAVYLDETYTFRIIMNLLSNAQKFCESGCICLSVRMSANEQITLEVSDTGCGIPKSFRSSLFQPFRQADMSATRSRQGTGLGLSIVKQLVQRMNGVIDVSSIEGEGSVFTVKLPVAVPVDLTYTQPSLPPKHIKIVYQHKKTAELLAYTWAQYGFVTSFGSAESPVSELINGVDAIWSDVESVRLSCSLKELLRPQNCHPPIYIAYTDTSEFGTLEPTLSSSRRIILVRRPVIMHNVLESLLDPESHLGPHTNTNGQGKVRFTIPEGDISSKGKCREVESVTPPEPISRPISSARTKGKILLVEDNIVNQHLGQRLLEKLGYDVDTARDGQEAVAKVQQTTFVCCLMDCQMPVLDGFTATSKIRELENNGTIHGRLPIIALTANVSNENEDKCRTAGMDQFLSKPLKLSQLQSCIEQFSGGTNGLK